MRRREAWRYDATGSLTSVVDGGIGLLEGLTISTPAKLPTVTIEWWGDGWETK